MKGFLLLRWLLTTSVCGVASSSARLLGQEQVQWRHVNSQAEDTQPSPGFEEVLENQKVLQPATRSIEQDRWMEVD